MVLLALWEHSCRALHKSSSRFRNPYGHWGTNNPVSSRMRKLQRICRSYWVGHAVTKCLSGTRTGMPLSDLCSAITQFANHGTGICGDCGGCRIVWIYDLELLSLGIRYFPSHILLACGRKPQKAIQWKEASIICSSKTPTSFLFFEENGLLQQLVAKMVYQNQTKFFLSGLAKTEVRFAYFKRLINHPDQLLRWTPLGSFIRIWSQNYWVGTWWLSIVTTGNSSDFWVQECSRKSGEACHNTRRCLRGLATLSTFSWHSCTQNQNCFPVVTIDSPSSPNPVILASRFEWKIPHGVDGGVDLGCWSNASKYAKSTSVCQPAIEQILVDSDNHLHQLVGNPFFQKTQNDWSFRGRII